MRHRNIAFFVPHLGCKHQCSFCDQRAISGQQAGIEPLEVERTLHRAFTEISERQETEIAFFGGSFTAIERGDMLALLEAAQPFLSEGGFAGIRISTRPDAIDRSVLELLREYGVSAIELGAQSMDERVLSLNGRGHTAGAVREASALIREYGFSLGLQMMTGLYGDSDEGAWRTARELAALGPDTVRIYPTVVLEGTRLAGLYRQGVYHPPGMEETIPLCAGLLEFFEQQDIRVIRLGLHASRDVEERLVAGAYHPALRELCEGELCFGRLWDTLKGDPPGRYEVWVHPGMHSKMTGQKRCNLVRLGALGYDIMIRSDRRLSPGEFQVRPAEESR